MVDLYSVLHPSDPARALALLDDGIRRLRGLSAAGADPRAQAALAKAYTGRAEALSQTPLESLQARNQAIAIYSALSKRRPPHADSERQYSMSLKRRAALYLTTLHDASRAMVDLTESAAIDERRVALDPGSAIAKLDLAIGDSYRSVVLRQTGDLPALFDALALPDRSAGTARPTPKTSAIRTAGGRRTEGTDLDRRDQDSWRSRLPPPPGRSARLLTLSQFPPGSGVDRVEANAGQ